MDSGQEAQLTFDGEKYFDYGTSPESNTTAVTERLGGAKRPPVAMWSPDSTKLVVQRLDQRVVRDLYLIQSSVEDEGGTVRPRLHTFKYPLLGDAKLATAELVILNIPGAKKQMVVSELGPLPFTTILSPIEMKLVWWSDDSRKVYFIHKERGDKALELYEIDSENGLARLLIEERASTHIEPNLSVENRPNVYVLDEDIIWFSERDGYGHLYVYDTSSGKLVKQITSGEWVVRDILHVDRRNHLIYFTAGGREPGRDPYFRHLYSVSIDAGSESVKLLTPEDADHEIWFSPTGSYFVDNFSTVDSIPKSFLRSSKDGETILNLEVSDFDQLFEFGFKWPERFSVKAREGKTDLYGVIYFPSDFDPCRKYPVIDDVYPGPTRTRCAKSFDPEPDNRKWIFMPQATAELGFIVVTLDGLGTPFRSKAFRDYSYGKFEEAGGLLDHVIALRELASSRPYMDLERVGIYGHSGGGYASARAIFDLPEFYKVAVSSAGVHDLRDYLPVGEKYQGLFEPGKYATQSNSTVAHKLKGKLLLVYGDMDDNVNPASTIRLIDALVKADKTFDVLVLPNKNHSFSSDPYFIRKRWEYFVRHLLGPSI